MNILSQVTGNEWQKVHGAVPNGNGNNPNYEKTVQLLTNLLLSENLLVLCGLGSSMYLKNSKGKRIAPTMKALWDEAKMAAKDNFQAILDKVHYKIPGKQDGNIEDLLSHCQMVLQLEKDQRVEDFVKSTERIIADKCRFPINGDCPKVHESFLRKVARRSPRLPRTRIFTTNYDLCFEVAASHTQFITIDGFSHTFPQEFDGGYFSYDLVKREQDRETPDYITNVFHLYKLHGSVDWEKKDSRIEKKPDTTKPCLIYPRQGKYQSSYDQPFGEMMARFQMALRQPNTGLLIIGFGFNDYHLVQPIMSAIQSNVSLRVMVSDPVLKESKERNDKRKSEIQDIEKLIKLGDPRLSLLTAKFEELVPIIPDLVAQTEEEVHRQRFQMPRGRAQ